MNCPIGFYAPYKSSSSASWSGNSYCNSCPIGYTTYSIQQDSQSDCSLCTAGYYRWASSCYSCPSGYYQSSSGTTSYCSTCNPGYYQSQLSASACEICPKGWYQNEYANTECKICEAGQYTGHSPTRESSTGSFDIIHCHDCSETWNFVKDGACAICPTDQSTTDGTEASCADCAVGRFSEDGQCKNCLAGYYQSQTGQSSCSACPNGYYQIATESSSCTICPTGKYQEQSGQNTCETCDAAKYGSEEGQTSCKSCSVNSEPDKYCTVYLWFNDRDPDGRPADFTHDKVSMRIFTINNNQLLQDTTDTLLTPWPDGLVSYEMSVHGDDNWITVANTFKNYHYYHVRYYSTYNIGFMPWYNIGGYSLYNGWFYGMFSNCLLYTSPSPRDVEESRMPSSA